ncbi:MAG TPA: ArsB/NhaD family transporter, partial [Candidatus Lustribacter sp.]|nr:ArsB/NhaD family transporter [Candidatus Lustribacter sp.]
VFLLFAMMVIVGILQKTGLFGFLAIWSAKRARGNPFRVMVLLCLITALASTVLNNVTTVMLVAPVTFLVCDRIGVRPEGYLIAEVMASNIGGTATLVGDPPNIIIASRAGLTFNEFLAHLGPVIAIILVVFLVMVRFVFRKDFTADPDLVADVMSLRERDAIEDPGLLVKGIAVLAVVLTGFVTGPFWGIEPSIVAILGAGALVALSRLAPSAYLAEVEWETLAFFVGLFVMVGAMVKVGAIEGLAHWLAGVTGGQLGPSVGVLLVGSAVLSAIVDNIPYVATMTPVVATLAGPGGPLAGHDVLWWALALGADLGGNATAIGASANVVVLGIAKRNGYPISFWRFTSYGIGITAVTIAISGAYLWIRYF